MFMLAFRASGGSNRLVKNDEHEIIQMERAALERWGRGDPSGFLEISAPEVVYFDPFHERRIDGLPALSALYESIRGQVHVDSFELVDPRVQEFGDVAVLTFVDVSQSGGKPMRWNCTEVYHRSAGVWRIVQTHWSLQCGAPE
jgi:ketosteroid isomerase-like protein